MLMDLNKILCRTQNARWIFWGTSILQWIIDAGAKIGLQRLWFHVEDVFSVLTHSTECWTELKTNRAKVKMCCAASSFLVFHFRLPWKRVQTKTPVVWICVHVHFQNGLLGFPQGNVQISLPNKVCLSERDLVMVLHTPHIRPRLSYIRPAVCPERLWNACCGFLEVVKINIRGLTLRVFSVQKQI